MQSEDVTIVVYGVPAPQGSKRHVGGGRMIESSKKVGPWRKAVVDACVKQNLGPYAIEGPVAVYIVFTLHRPKAAKPLAYPDKRPDLDKLIRSTFDALTTAGVWRGMAVPLGTRGISNRRPRSSPLAFQ